jgi:hypothetical protein
LSPAPYTAAMMRLSCTSCPSSSTMGTGAFVAKFHRLSAVSWRATSMASAAKRLRVSLLMAGMMYFSTAILKESLLMSFHA